MIDRQKARAGEPVEAVDAALTFLAGRQLPTGAFPVRVGDDPADAASAPDDAALFATSLVAHSLSLCEDDVARSMAARAAAYLREQMEPCGVWRHWTADHERYHALPADLDDTACISTVLRRQGVPFPDNAALLLANRDRRGLFHTWLVARWPPAPAPVAFWRVALRRWRRPLHARLFWRTSAAPRDVDGIVNANVLQYLGDGPHAPAVVEHLAGVLRRGEEDRCDKWYRSPFVLYYAIARCVRAGVSGAAALGDDVAARIRAAAAPDGRIGAGPLDTALGACALARLDAGAPELGRALAWLVGLQSPDGSWPAEAVYFGGPREDPAVPSWGSAELTTALSVEALCRAT